MLLLLLVIKYNKWIYRFVVQRKKGKMVSESDFMALIMFFLFGAVAFAYGWYMSWISIIIDENDTSPADYSILVSNMPVSATTIPGVNIQHELKNFFEMYYELDGKPRCRWRRSVSATISTHLPS